MNIKMLFYALLASVSLVSCNLETENNSSPSILMARLPISLKNDTFKIKPTEKENVYLMDTMTVGDTLKFQLILQGYYNNLKTFGLTQYSDSSTRVLLAPKTSLDSIFSSNSNYSQGKFYMLGNYSSMAFVFKYVARKPSNEAKLIFNVTSDANIEQYYKEFEIRTPIKNKK